MIEWWAEARGGVELGTESFGKHASLVNEFREGRISRLALFNEMPLEYRRMVLWLEKQADGEKQKADLRGLSGGFAQKTARANQFGVKKALQAPDIGLDLDELD